MRAAVQRTLNLRLGGDRADTDVSCIRIPRDQLRQRIQQTRNGERQLQTEDALLDEHVADGGKRRDVRRAQHRNHLAAGEPAAERWSVDHRSHGARMTRGRVSTQKYSPHMTLSSTPGRLVPSYDPCVS